MIKEVTAGELEEIVKKGDLVIVDFSATWCSPCKRFHKILQELDRIYDGVITIVSIDVDKNREFAKEHEVRAVPTVMFYRNGGLVGFTVKGELIDRFTGVKPLEFLNKIITTIIKETD